MSRKVQVLGRSGRNSLQKSTSLNVSVKRQSLFQRLNYSPSVPGPISTDSNFRYNTLLIHADGSSGANNTVFLNNSSSTTFIPFSGTYSWFFNGSTDYLTSPYQAGITTFSGNFTIEAWIYVTSSTLSYNGIFTTGSETTNRLTVGFNSSRQLVLDIFGTTNTFTGGTFSLNTWTHVAFVRSATNITAYINGISTGTATSSATLGNATGGITIGKDNSTNYFTGYISNLRILNGTNLYNSSFNPPTTPLTAIANTSLLTCQSSTFIDNSTNNFTLTQSGPPIITSGSAAIKIGGGKPLQGTFSPFSQTGWSNLFNGSTDYLQFPRAAGLITTGPFTVEAWVNIAAHKTSNMIISNQYWSIGQNGGWGVSVNSSGNVEFAASEQVFNTFPILLTSTSPLLVNTWYHVAVVRDQNNFLNLYINGALAARPVLYNFDLSRNTGGTQTNWLTNIGINNADGTNFNFINGYVSNARIVKGIAVYTEPFNPPTTPLSVIGTPDNTTLLTCRDNRLQDSSFSNNAITVAGTPTVQVYSPIVSGSYSTATVGGSVRFDGSSFLEIANYPSELTLGTKDFTIEMWVYPTAAPTTGWNPFLSIGNGVPGAGGLEIRISQNINNTGWGWLYPNNTNNGDVYAGFGTLTLNVWHHLAMVRSGSNLYLFRNGVQVSSATGVSFNLTNNTAIRLGASTQVFLASDGYITGHISNFKLVVGKALYTSTFTPPTSPATTSDAPVLLLNGTNSGIIDNTGRNNLTTYGSAAISSTQSKFGGTSMYFDGSTGYITALPGNLFNFGTADFTIEAWIYTNSSASQRILSINNACEFLLVNNGSNVWLNFYDGVADRGSNSFNVPQNQWVHVAVVRSNSVMSTYINGTLSNASPTVTTNLNAGATNIPYIGRYGPSALNYFSGYIDDLRISKVARYTANFTPPTAAFADQ